MKTPKLVVSSSRWNLDNFSDWLEDVLLPLRDAIREENPIRLEIQVKRGARSGNLEVPPSIDQLDELRRIADTNGAAFTSLSIPVFLSESEEAAGVEISWIDGWTDLAAYLDMNLLRFVITQGSDITHLTATRALHQTLDYALDQNFTIGLFSECGPPSMLASFLDAAPREGGGACGLDMPLVEAPPPAEIKDFRVSCLHAAIDAADARSELNRLHEQWEPLPAAQNAYMIITLDD